MPSLPLPRRTLLAAGAAIAASAVTRRAHAAPPVPTLGIQIYSLRGFPVDVALQHVHDLGIKAVEFFPGIALIDEQGAKEAARRFLEGRDPGA